MTGNLYATDSSNNHVQVSDCKGQFLYTFSDFGEKGAPSNFLHGICVISDQFVYGMFMVCDSMNNV